MKNRHKPIRIKLPFLWISIALVLLTTIQCFAQSYPFQIKHSIYQNGWLDLNKNGKMDPYENPNPPVEDRLDDLISRMNVNELMIGSSSIDKKLKGEFEITGSTFNKAYGL